MDDLRTVVAANLRALMDHQADRGWPYVSARAVAAKAGVNKNTVQRLLLPTKGPMPAIDTLDAIAKVFKLRAWQLLIPGLVPSNPPVVSLTQAERDLYERLTDVAREALKHEQAGSVLPGDDRGPGYDQESAAEGPQDPTKRRAPARR